MTSSTLPESVPRLKVGVVLPQLEIGSDPAPVRDFVQAVEDVGYHHLLAFEHVLGAHPTNRSGEWLGYTHKDLFHEPFVLFGYLGAVTQRLELATGILILPQRQAPLVAKQAAEVDVLTRGRLRLGVGVGWNAVEFAALGQVFRTRGRRIEEQIAVLRALWTSETVTFRGTWHHLDGVGINPLPVRRPIPVWIGGDSDAVIERAGRLADGWVVGPGLRTPFLRHLPRPGGDGAAINRLREAALRAGRDPRSIGVEQWIRVGDGTPADWLRVASEWVALGGTHISVNTMGAGLAFPEGHIEAVRRFKSALSDLV